MRRRLFLLLLAVPLLSSCAYYNTFYLARRYYDRANEGLPYPVEKPNPADAQNYNKSVDYAKKLIATYPKSKWVDDAYLLWARALLGKDDPLQTITMLREFPQRYPNSTLKDEATFYLGVGYRQSRKYSDAVSAFEEFLAKSPKHELAPYAHLERARALMALKRPAEASQAASQVVERFPKSKLHDQAMLARAEALVAQGEYQRAREDYRTMGRRARTDDERFNFLLKEADALEAARRYDEELVLLRDALSHEREPAVADTAGLAAGIQQAVAAPEGDRWGRLQTRVGTVHMLEGRKDEALIAYRRVLDSYPRTNLGAEAQYRIGYVQETVGDDFEAARAEYGRVRTHSSASQFTAQANQRLANLERLAQFRSAGGDSLTRQAEASFLLAEQYLFQLDKPDRAVTEYRKIARELRGTPLAAKAMNAEAWVLRTRYQKQADADSIWWKVVREYPATEAQLAARDYLEAAGHTVADNLIKPPPEPEPPPVDTAAVALTPPPSGPMPLGPAARALRPDSLGTRPDPAALVGPPAPPAPVDPRRLLPPAEPPGLAAARARVDSLARVRADSLRYARGVTVPADSIPRAALRDTLRPPAPPDTSRRGR